MIETQGPALEAESKYRRDKARDALAVRRAAYERRAARAAQVRAAKPHAGHGLTAALHGWTWHPAR